MKVLVIGHLTGKDIQPHLQAEGAGSPSYAAKA